MLQTTLKDAHTHTHTHTHTDDVTDSTERQTKIGCFYMHTHTHTHTHTQRRRGTGRNRQRPRPCLHRLRDAGAGQDYPALMRTRCSCCVLRDAPMRGHSGVPRRPCTHEGSPSSMQWGMHTTGPVAGQHTVPWAVYACILFPIIRHGCSFRNELLWMDASTSTTPPPVHHLMTSVKQRVRSKVVRPSQCPDFLLPRWSASCQLRDRVQATVSVTASEPESATAGAMHNQSRAGRMVQRLARPKHQ
jgi:hypothetical protein